MKELRMILNEIREMLKVITERQQMVMKNIINLKEENKRLREEVNQHAIVLNSMYPITKNFN